MSAISLVKNKIFSIDISNFKYAVLALMPFFLLVNKLPYLAIISFLLLLVMSITFFLKNKLITDYHLGIIILLLIVYSYLLISYFLSGQTLRNLFSYGFLRYDGSIFFGYLSFFIFSTAFLDYRKALKIYFWFLFIAFSIFAIIGFFEYSNNLQFLTIRLDDIYVGPMFVALNNSHNATGSIYAIVGVAALAFLLESSSKRKIAYAGIFILCFIALFITKSRGSLIAFFIGAFFTFWLNSKSVLKFIRNLFILIALLISFMFMTGTFTRVMQIFYVYDLSALTRFSLWEKAITLFRNSPILGIGFGRYNDVLWNFDRVPLTGRPGIFAMYTMNNFAFNDTNAHSSYLHFLAETGIIGLILIISFWLTCFIIVFKGYRFTKDIFSKKVYLSVLGCILTLFALSITENYMTAPTVMTCISVITSLAVGLYWSEKNKITIGR